MNLPKDPVLLLSIVNTELRDFYPSLEAFCEDRHVKKEFIISAMKSIDYEYDGRKNRFV